MLLELDSDDSSKENSMVLEGDIASKSINTKPCDEDNATVTSVELKSIPRAGNTTMHEAVQETTQMAIMPETTIADNEIQWYPIKKKKED